MVISSFISSVLVLALGIWAFVKLEPAMNMFAEKQLLIEPNKFSYKMWKDMPVSMYQSFTFFNCTNWNQVKSFGQKPKFVEVGPYVYKTIWSKSEIDFLDEDKLVSFSERKQWHFQAALSRGQEDDQIWTINTPLMTALALIQNAPVITRNIVSVILDGLGEGAFIKRPIRSLLFEGYSDLIVLVGPLFDRRFANFNGKFAYLYNKNDSIDGTWTVSTGIDDLTKLNRVTRFQSNIVNLTSIHSGQMPHGLNEVKAECASAWSFDEATNGQLFAPFNRGAEQAKLQRQLLAVKAKSAQANQQPSTSSRPTESIVQGPKRFFSRISASTSNNHQQQDTSSSLSSTSSLSNQNIQNANNIQTQQRNIQDKLQQLRDFGKYIFYPDLCRSVHLLPSKQLVTSENGIEASRYTIDPHMFMNSSQVPSNKCYEMNPKPPLANALAATINSVTGANVNVPNLVSSASSPFSMFIPPNSHHHHNIHNNHQNNHNREAIGGIFERANHPSSFLNNALHSLQVGANQAADQLISSTTNNSPIASRLGRVRQLFTNMVSQRMSAAAPLLPSLTSGSAGGGAGGLVSHFSALSPTARNSLESNANSSPIHTQANPLSRQGFAATNYQQADPLAARLTASSTNNNLDSSQQNAALQQATPSQESQNSPPFVPQPPLLPQQPPQTTQAQSSDRWITQFRFKWPRGVFSIGQCQLGAPIYVSLPHFLDADEYYLEQVDGLKPNRSLHEFYIDIESTLHSIPVSAKARLQLNVATPELRFRNIPNAMIPVLWQEVTFKIDKPVANMLYWSFTMSSTIYEIISVIIICIGLALFVWSFVGGVKHRRTRRIEEEIRNSSRASGSTQTSECDLRANPLPSVSTCEQPRREKPYFNFN